MNDLKIIIIGFYYGTFPAWMDYWLRSCADNQTIDFLIVSDNDLTDIPSNVRLVRMSLSDVRELCIKKLQTNISLNNPYKLCDLKPFYGIILEDYIGEYDYWGHCDFDLIWGDIRTFIEKYDIQKYDKFLPLGHLSLYRNDVCCRAHFEKPGSRCGSYKEVLNTEQTCGFDEINGIYSIYATNKIPMFVSRIFAEIKTYPKRFKMKFVDRNYRHQVFYYENGKVLRAYVRNRRVYTEEYIYIHFRRKLPVFGAATWRTLGAFYISSRGLVDKPYGEPTVEQIKENNPYSGWLYEIWETAMFCLSHTKGLLNSIKFLIMAMKGKIKR